MKIAVYSDLHTEFDPEGAMWVPPSVDADVIIFAGDICTGPVHMDLYATLVERAHPNVARFIYVAGNHEWYSGGVRFGGSGYERYRSEFRKHERSVFLEADTYQLGGITFVGCTLWSDLSAADSALLCEKLNDFNMIRIDEPPYRKLRPSDVTKAWRRSVRFLKDCRPKFDPRTAIVITHHSPTFEGLDEVRKPDADVLIAYASELRVLIEQWQPLLWVHGHVHEKLDRKVGNTHIVCNPRGYNTKSGDSLVTAFDPTLLLDVGDTRSSP